MNKPDKPDLENTDSQKNSLLYLLLELFTRITNRLSYRRIHRYYDDSPRHDCDAFISPLETLLEKLSAVESVNGQTKSIRTTYLSSHDSNTAVPMTDSGADNVPGLSEYFKSHNNIMIMHPYLSEKLKAAALENLHAAIRLTRQHNERVAKLHLQIARDAITELTHFLPAQELDDFFQQTISLTDQVAHYNHINHSDNPVIPGHR